MRKKILVAAVIIFVITVLAVIACSLTSLGHYTDGFYISLISFVSICIVIPILDKR
jgi:hypothetical protein